MSWKAGLNEIAEQVHLNAVEHGFWDEQRNTGEMIALMHAELSEALEEHRAGRPVHYYSESMPAVSFAQPVRKPEGVAVELIDCMIRILDLLATYDVDIEDLVLEKMVYNAGRPRLHGKKY